MRKATRSQPPLHEHGERVALRLDPGEHRRDGFLGVSLDCELAAGDALAALGTGLAVGNLWYLNYSDRPACRMTGMTRFATFWVDNGRVAAPANVLRFDDTLYRMLGTNLESLTAERELLLDPDTYGERNLASATLPGALLSEINFTL